MSYKIRVDFPDEDKYAFVTDNDGEVILFADHDTANKEALKYAGGIAIKVEDYESIPWTV
jgi:hypothetical protein